MSWQGRKGLMGFTEFLGEEAGGAAQLCVQPGDPGQAGGAVTTWQERR